MAFLALLAVGCPFYIYAQAQPATVLPNPGLVPGNPFYFLDRIGESLREFFTFNPEGKARLQLVFAAERISEIKIILETKGVDAPGLDVAKARLQVNIERASGIVESEKSRGRDVKALAQDLDDEFSGHQNALHDIFHEQKDILKAQERELKDQIKAARKAGDEEQLKALKVQLQEVKDERRELELKKDEMENELDEQEERLEKEVEMKIKAEKAIQEAEKEKLEFLAEADEEDVVIPSEALNAFNEHLEEAKVAFAAGKFEEAKHHAEEAEESLDKIERGLKDLEKAKDLEEELKEKQEELEENAKTEKEGIKGEREKEKDQLEAGVEKAREAVRKAQEELLEIGNEADED